MEMPLRPDPLLDCERVLVLAPVGRDAATVCAVLGEAGMDAVPIVDLGALCAEIERGAGAVLVAEEALSAAGIAALKATLAKQAPWSDLPIVLVTGSDENQEARVRALQLFGPVGNVTILERPFQKLTLVTAFEAALRARRRQYHMRGVMAEHLRGEQRRAEDEALRRSEALYRALARNYPGGAVLLVDRALTCTLAEGQGLPLLGLSREAVEGRAIVDALPPDFASIVARCCHAALEGRTATNEMTAGERIHLVHCVPLPGAEGEAASAMIVTQDITAQKHAEEELRRDAELRERFIGVLAHDLRTPLQAIAFTADKLARAGLPEVTRTDTRRIALATERMSRMIRDLLDLARSRSGAGIPITAAADDLAAICGRAIEEIQAAHPQRVIRFAARGDTHGRWDADRLSQVVTNLVGNALAYSPLDTAVDVDLSARAEEAVLRVENRGPPIAAEVLPTLFAPYARGAHDGGDTKHGLGLGLFIVDCIVRAHGGAIDVESSEKRGTVFTVTLPIVHEALSACGEAPSSRRVSRVLVAEDDADIRRSVVEVLTGEGYEVITASDGREALDLLAGGERPCLILLDLMMPSMSGWDVLEALRADRRLASLPVVVLSAAAGREQRLEGARRCLPKPLMIQSLLEAVEEHCAPPGG
jgi:PAS domain S-box-containing protein